jgi:hypothetical protein
MLRCDKCDVRIDESQHHRTKFSMEVWCTDIRHVAMYGPDVTKHTDYGDLCESCQKKAFGELNQLAERFNCVADKKGVPTKELAGSLVEKH